MVLGFHLRVMKAENVAKDSLVERPVDADVSELVGVTDLVPVATVVGDVNIRVVGRDHLVVLFRNSLNALQEHLTFFSILKYTYEGLN